MADHKIWKIAKNNVFTNISKIVGDSSEYLYTFTSSLSFMFRSIIIVKIETS